MVLVTSEHRLTPDYPTQKGRRGVEHGYGGRQQGHGDGHQRRTFGGAFDTQAGEQKAGEQAPRVAQERPGRWEIEREKSEERSRQRGSHQADRGMAQRHGHDEDRRRGEERRAGRDPVRAVEQVERVGDTHQPENRNRDARYEAELERAEREGQEFYPHTQVVNEQRRDALHRELDGAAQRSHVVDGTEQQERRGADRDGPQVFLRPQERKARGGEHQADQE